MNSDFMKFNIVLLINYQFIIYAVLCGIVLCGIYWKCSYRKLASFEIDEAEIGIGTSKIKLRLNIVDMQIAYKIWVELSTRKIGLPIDYEHDVITEVYNSWYNFFSITRELLKDVPVSKVCRPDTQKIINISIEVLNQGVRPHLTKWQAMYRKWYDLEYNLPENTSKTPQEIQRNYPRYEELVEDLKKVNERLIKYKINIQKLFIK